MGHGCGYDLLLTLRDNQKEKKKIPVWEMILLYFLVDINEMAVGGDTSNILYNLLPKVIIKM